MRKKKKDEEVNEFEQAEKEAEANPEAEAALEAQVPTSDDADVKRPELQGRQKDKPKFEQPGTNNIKSEDIGAKSETEE